MSSDSRSSWTPEPGGHGESVRRRVVDAAADLLRGGAGTAVSGDGRPDGSAFPSDAADQGATTLYLALLQDRLPVYARTMKALDARAGQAGVADNLALVAEATIEFYAKILTAKVSVFTVPEQLVRLRQVLKTHGLGPHAAHDAVAGYLRDEQDRGRVLPEVDCAAAAWLLLGACVNYAFTKVLMDDVPAPERYVTEIVHGLRITP